MKDRIRNALVTVTNGFLPFWLLAVALGFSHHPILLGVTLNQILPIIAWILLFAFCIFLIMTSEDYGGGGNNG